MEETISLGVIQKPFGLKGEVLCKSLTSFPEERFQKDRHFFLKSPKDGSLQEVSLRSFRPSGDYFYLSFEEFQKVEDVESLRGYTVETPLSEAPLPEGFYRLRDLVGLKVVDAETGEELGHIQDVLSFSSSPILKVKRGPKSYTVPFVFGPFVETIDLEKKECRIHVIEGLL